MLRLFTHALTNDAVWVWSLGRCHFVNAVNSVSDEFDFGSQLNNFVG